MQKIWILTIIFSYTSFIVTSGHDKDIEKKENEQWLRNAEFDLKRVNQQLDEGLENGELKKEKEIIENIIRTLRLHLQ